MNEKFELNVLTICGSARANSFNRALVRALPLLSPGGMVFTESLPVINLPHYDFDLQQVSGPPAAAMELGSGIRDADAVIIVSPEYNYSIPGILKNALDWVSRVPKQPLAGKPVLIQSVSGGLLGGARMQYHLRQVLVSLDARVFLRPEVMVGMATSKFDEAGNLIDEATRLAVQTQLAAFASFVRERSLS
jgi:chromate reductase